MTAPSSLSLAWHPAALSDAPAVLESMEAFYAEEKLPFDGRIQGRALDVLLTDPALGAVFLLHPSGSPKGDSAALGHLVLTRGHSLEFGGCFLLLDELYLSPAIRGRGEGRRALTVAVEHAKAVGAQALRLEVSHENTLARGAYLRAGFVAEKRDLMTLRLV